MIEDASQNHRYECRWRDVEGRQVHYWVDHSPTQPHWPDSAVMRWDLRQRDWDKIWPELIDHPCAILFAPRHPHRSGPRSFKDWVGSWPDGFDWEVELPKHLHGAIRKAIADLAAGTASSPLDTTDPDPNESGSGVEQQLQTSVQRRHGTDDLVEQLVVALLEVDDSVRQALAQQLQVLALAPDSGRVVQTLKNLFAHATAGTKGDA